VKEQKDRGFCDTKVTTDTTTDGDHGRIETRKVTVIHNVDWLQERHAWPGLKAVIVVDSERVIGARIEQETRYYITSLDADARFLGSMVRGHWAIENSLLLRFWI